MEKTNDMISRQAATGIVWKCYEKAMSIEGTDYRRLLAMADFVSTTLAFMPADGADEIIGLFHWREEEK